MDDIFRRRRREFYQQAFRILRDRELANDILQDAFVRALRHLDKLEKRNDPAGWIRRILTNLCLDRLRRKHLVMRSLDLHVAEPTAPDSVSPGYWYEARELVTNFESALAGLSSVHREILTMRVVREMSYAEIAEAFECPLGTVMSRLYHARRGLRTSGLDV